MKTLITKYIESKQMAWSPTTIRSEEARLRASVSLIELGPQAAYMQLSKTHNPYTIKTTFIRLSAFIDFVGNKENKFKLFLKENKRLFQHAYKKEKLDVTFEEALERIKKINDKELREKALQLITTGARWTESTTLDGSGFVQSKGGRQRKLLNASHVGFQRTYSQFLRLLKKETGLKPHSLRKLFATRLVDSGFTLPDLMAVMGWTSSQTAMSYLQSKREDELTERIEKLVG